MDRIIIASEKKSIAAKFSIDINGFGYHSEKIYNGSQSYSFPVLTSSSNQFAKMNWGSFDPIKKISYTSIKIDQLKDNAEFINSIQNFKCLVPCNCFSYIFRNKRYLMFNERERLFALAGVYTSYLDRQGNTYLTFVILTETKNIPGELNGSFEAPVIISEVNYSHWLDKNANPTPLLNTNLSAHWNAFQVSDRMNNISLNSIDLLSPIGPRLIQPRVLTSIKPQPQDSKKKLAKVSLAEKADYILKEVKILGQKVKEQNLSYFS